MKRNQTESLPGIRHTLPALLVLILIGCPIYAGSLHAPFVFDDSPHILENPYIRMTDISATEIAEIAKSPSSRRPLPNFTIALNYFCHQYEVFGYHIVNLLIHIITAALVFFFTSQTLALCRIKQGWLPLFAALVWLANPLHTQSVTYIVQRMNALSAMFYMLSLACYIAGRRR